MWRFSYSNNRIGMWQIEFFSLIKTHFLTVYDIKHLMKFCSSRAVGGGEDWYFVIMQVRIVCLLIVHLWNWQKIFSVDRLKYTSVLYGLGIENGQDTYQISNNNEIKGVVFHLLLLYILLSYISHRHFYHGDIEFCHFIDLLNSVVLQFFAIRMVMGQGSVFLRLHLSV